MTAHDPNLAAATLAAFRKAFETPMGDTALGNMLAKSTFAQNASATSGLTYYDLELGAKLLFPVLTPLRNFIPRVSGKGGIQAAWRAITGINTSGIRLGVSGGNRGGVMAVTTQDYTAAYKGIGLEGSVDFEAQYAGQGFDDIRALNAQTLLESVMIGEEQMILGGDGSVALGTTPTPTAAAVTSGGALADATYSVICVALTLDGYLNGTVAGGIQAQITRTNADGSSDTFGGGAAGQSAAASAVLSGGSNLGSVTAKVAVVKGAVAYAWFWGTAGSEKLGAITTINSYVITAAAAGTQTALSLGVNDNSINNLAFDGIMAIAAKSGSNAYIASQAVGTLGTGTPLTADGAGGVTEVDVALKSLWDNYRLSPDTIWCNSQEALNLSKKIQAGNANGANRIVFNMDRDNIGGGVMIRSYLNRFSMNGGQNLDIRIHPNMPPGTLLMTTNKLPYPLANVGNVMQIRTRQDYYNIAWPLRSRKYEQGVYADQVLQHYFPPSIAIINNIANG